MQCQRVPPFPLEKDGPLFKEVIASLRSSAALSLEQLDALFCACAQTESNGLAQSSAPQRLAAPYMR